MKKLILLLIVFSMATSMTVTAQTIYDLQKNKTGVDSELARIKAEQSLQSQKAKYFTNLADNLEMSEAEQYAQLEAFESELTNTEMEIAQLLMEIGNTEKLYLQKTEEMKNRIVEAYIYSKISLIDILSKAQGLSDLYQQLEIRRYMARYDQELMNEVATLKKDLEFKKALTEELKDKYEVAVSNTKVAIQNMQAIKDNAEKAVVQSQQRIDQLNDREAQLYKEAQDLLKRILELQKIHAYVGGEMLWPLPSVRRVPTGLAAFGYRLHPIFKQWRMHTGIDIGAATGTSIVSANNGTVILAGYTQGYGNRVVVDHGGGVCTLYAHASRLLVRVGDRVEQGQVIALVGSTGWSTGPHLHFEVIKDGKHVDPMLHLNINR
ncbi:MAG: peptidoglycan DD-metalloendopeptidase family protein [Clostridia bacterium]